MKLDQGNSTLRVCVDSVTNGQISGRVFGQRLEKPVVFADIGDLLLQIDDVLNVQDYPRAAQRKRSFAEQKQAVAQPPGEIGVSFMSIELVKTAFGETATFNLSILMRQNTSWQGNIDWLDGKKPVGFRSVLEFIRIVYEALKEA